MASACGGPRHDGQGRHRIMARESCGDELVPGARNSDGYLDSNLLVGRPLLQRWRIAPVARTSSAESLFARQGRIYLYVDICAPARNIVPASRFATASENRETVMGFIKFSKGFALSDKDKKSLKKLLEAERKRLLAAMKEVDQNLSMLGSPKKKTEKKKKAKR